MILGENIFNNLLLFAGLSWSMKSVQGVSELRDARLIHLENDKKWNWSLLGTDHRAVQTKTLDQAHNGLSSWMSLTRNKTLMLGYYWWAGIQADSFQCWIVTVWESISDEQNQCLPSHSWSLWLGLCWCIDHIWVCRELLFCRFHPDQSWHSDILQMIQESPDSGEVPCPCQLPWCISQCHRCLLLLSRSQFEILISLIGFIDHH